MAIGTLQIERRGESPFIPMSLETLALLEKLAAIAYGAKSGVSAAAAFPNEHVRRQYVEIVGHLLSFADETDIAAAVAALKS